MKNNELYTIVVTGCSESLSEYYAVSNFNNWKSIQYSKREDAVNKGELHAKILKTIYPNLKGDNNASNDESSPI